MAIDKSRTRPWMKGVIIFICVAFVLGIGSFAVEGLLTSSQISQQAAQQGQNGQSSVTTSQSVEAIGLQYTPVIKSREASLAADPGNYELNVLQGQTYFDWAAAVTQATQGAQGTNIWKAALPFFHKALKVKPGDPSVTTDSAIAQYYSGDVKGAIATAEGVTAKDPSFSPAQFNLGIFYQADNNTAKAKAALEKYLQMDPNGPSAAAAKGMLSKLK